MEAELSREAHSSEVMSVVWVEPGLVVSGSADHSLRMWTTDGQCVGCFGQPPQSWTSPAAATLSCQLSSLNPHATGRATSSSYSVFSYSKYVWMKVRGSRGTEALYVCCIYMPTDSACASVIGDSYIKLKADVPGFMQKWRVVLLGYFNARVGRSADDDDVIGMFGEETCNAGGNRLISFLNEVELVVCNGRS